MSGIVEMSVGKIYYISYGATTLIARFKDSDTCHHNFFEYLHYWAGYETFYKGGNVVKNGIEEIRPASDAEKHTLLKFAIEKNTI